MPHEVDGQVHWHEPSGLSAAGVSRFLRPAAPYDRYMDQEGLPPLRATAIADLAALPRHLWRRLGGRGAHLQPFGTEGALGLALIEVPAGGALRPEKHLFDEIVLVLEGRGTTEAWLPGEPPAVFEWQPGSLFSIPTNALHRLVNATAAPALVLSASNAPALLNLLSDVDAVFANPFVFRDRFNAETGQAFDDIEPDPVRGLAVCRTTLVPDAIGCDLPLDNRHSPGYRQLSLAMTGSGSGSGSGLLCTLGEHRPGRYAKAHVLPHGMATLCLNGSGLTYLWPEHLGPTPWQDGHAAQVQQIALQRHAMLGTGPSPGRWYRQHIVTSKAPLRLLHLGVPDRADGVPGTEMADPGSTPLAEGGTMIGYDIEDPFVRAEHARLTQALGLVCRMRDDDYA